MALTSLGVFCLEAAAGTALLLFFFPTRDLGRGFFSLHGLIALLFLLFAALSRPPGLPKPAAWGAAVLLGAYTLAAHAGKPAIGRPLLAAGALLCLWCLARAALSLPRGAGGVWITAGVILGGLFLGAVLLIMNLGHWYLVSRSLPFRLLARGAVLYAALAAARTALLAAAIATHWGGESVATLLSPEREGIFFLFRVLWGVAGPLALSYFIWKTADMRSNQATTGLLYVALVFVLIGELLSSYLTVATGFPA